MMNRSVLLSLAALLAAAAPASAQELVAWPIGTQSPYSAFWPGSPIRPLPIRPIPRPGPGPQPVPIPGPSIPPEEGTRLGITGYRVSGKVAESAAELETTVIFHNPTGSRLEGVLVVPIPADTVLSGFNMTVGGKTLKGELLEAGQASTIYENIVRQMRDPGLLELVGERMLRAKVFPIEPDSDVVVRIALSQILAQSGGLYSLTLPMRSARIANAQAEGASVHLALTAASPIRTIYSPLDGVQIHRQGDRAAAISYESRQTPAGDLSVFYSLARGPLVAGLTSFKEDGEDGTFMLTLAPRRNPTAGGAVPKDLVFVVDRSGSMEDNGKIKQVKAALSYCVSKLKPADRFGIVDFATDANVMDRGLLPATEENKSRALRYIERMEAAGGTDIEGALGEGLSMIDGQDGRMAMLFFLTDGLPTMGETRPEELLRKAAEKNKGQRARVFVFGVGDDVNTLLLDKLAQANRGSQDYVRPGESIEAKVSSLYLKVAEPALTDVRLSWNGVDVDQVYPRRIDDVFFGSEIVLLGRYKGWGKGSLVVTGKAAGKEARFEYPVELPERADSNGFLPKLWANQKVSHELDAIRLSGRADPEVVDGIVRLAKRYGIVTPYTSYLITEEGMDMGLARRKMEVEAQALSQDASMSGMGGAGGGGAAVAARAQKASRYFAAMSGRPAAAPSVSALRGAVQSKPGADGSFDQSKSEARAMSYESAAGAASAPMAQGMMLAQAESDAREELKEKGIRTVETRAVGGKTFYLRGGEWVDGALDGMKDALAKAVTVRYMSEEYFKLLKDEPELRRYMTLGSKLLVSHKGKAYRITE